MNPLDKDRLEKDNENLEKPQVDDSKKEKDVEEEVSKGGASVKVDGKDNSTIGVGGDFINSFIDMAKKEEHHYNVEKLNAPNLSAGSLSNSNAVIGNGNIVINVNDNLDSQALAEYGRFFVIGLCFYHGLSVPDFLSVLDATKKYLSQKIGKGNKINFPSRHPDVKTLEEFDSERLSVTIKFLLEDGVSVGDIFTKVVKKDYVPELFNYATILSEIVETQPNNWEMRWRSAVGLGQISELDVRYVFNKLINVWAQDERAFVRATVGYYFYYILSGDAALPEGAQKFLLEMLEKWATPKDFKESKWKYKWTVAAICEKIAHLKNEQAQILANKYLELVAGINHVRVADSVVHALVDWSIKQKFPQVFRLLVSWAESGSAGDKDEDNPYEIRCIVALVAFSAIVEVNYDLLNDKDNQREFIFPVDVLRTIWENQSDKENFWLGMVSIGVRYFDFKMGHYFFDMLESWTEIVSDKEFLADFVSSWLKAIYFDAHSKTHLENRLKNVWAKSKNKTLKSIAQLTQEKIKKGI